MVHRDKTPAVPGKDETFTPPAAALVVQVRLPPLARGEPVLPVPEMVAADAGAPESGNGPQIPARLPSPLPGLALGHELGRKPPVVRPVQGAEDLRQFPRIDPCRELRVDSGRDLFARGGVGPGTQQQADENQDRRNGEDRPPGCQHGATPLQKLRRCTGIIQLDDML